MLQAFIRRSHSCSSYVQTSSTAHDWGSGLGPSAGQGVPRWDNELGGRPAGDAQCCCCPRLFGSYSRALRVLFGHPAALPYQARQQQNPHFEPHGCSRNLQVCYHLPDSLSRLHACLPIQMFLCLWAKASHPPTYHLQSPFKHLPASHSTADHAVTPKLLASGNRRLQSVPFSGHYPTCLCASRHKVCCLNASAQMPLMFHRLPSTLVAAE